MIKAYRKLLGSAYGLPSMSRPWVQSPALQKKKKKLLQDEKSYQLNRHNIIIEDYAAQFF
jgi:hypothetical protein